MRQLRALQRRSWPDRLLLAQAGLIVAVVRLMISLVPFRLWKRLIVQQASVERQAEPVGVAVVPRVTAAVRTTSRYIPAATCLTQAIATQLLLGWRGYTTQLHIGVAKGLDGQLQAHAWIEKDGRVIIGGSEDLGQFRILPISGGQQL